MSKKNVIAVSLLVMSITLLFSTRAFSAEILLKSGTKVKGDIISVADKYMKVWFHGTVVTLYFKDIESVDGHILNAAKTDIVSGIFSAPISITKAVAEVVPNPVTLVKKASEVVAAPAEVVKNISDTIYSLPSLAPRSAARDRRAYTQKTAVKLKDRIVRIALPKEWINLPKYAEDEARPGAVFVRDEPQAEFDIYVSEPEDLPAHSDRISQIQFLDVQKTELQKQARVLGYEWVSDGYDELLNVPCLVATYGKFKRELNFIKDSRLYTVIFRTRNKDDFYNEWPSVEASLGSLEITNIG